MTSKTIGIMTSDFRLFYDLAEALKSMGLQFTSLTFRGAVPPHVGVVLTSAQELDDVFFEPKVAADVSVKAAIRRSLIVLSGRERADLLHVGVDPGETPGVAVLFKGRVLEAHISRSPEDAGALVLEIAADYAAERTVVRIGDGDEDNRNRILRLVCGKVDRCEIVDEKTTSSPSTTDMDSAATIARTWGYSISKPARVSPRPGKLRDLQRKSRIESNGSLTLSKTEAKAVADGRLTMEEAVKLRKKAR